MKKHKKHFWAFTLVELIIVITILAILASIAFMSFRSYSWNARDGNKLATFSNIETGLSLYQVKTGSYPSPDDIYGSGSYSWNLLSQVWYVWSWIVQSISMNTIPKDPIVDFKYTYWLSNDKRYYQLWTVLETDEWSIEPQNYVWNYRSKVVWNYKWLYKFTWIDSNEYITNLPSLIFTQTGTQNFENFSTNPNFNPKFVINNGWNLVKPYDESNNRSIDATLLKLTGNEVSLTWIVIPSTEDWKSGSWALAENLWYSKEEVWHELYGENYDVDRNNVQSPPIITWKDETGTNCDNDDYVFTSSEWVTYRWAWCNSVFWTGYEWSGNNCYDYFGEPLSCWTTQMASTAKENAWNTTTGTVNNIWWKLYTYAQATATTWWACPTGWHLPDDDEWTALETHLNGSLCRTINDWQCNWLWWIRDSSKNTTNNIVEALKIPLAGNRDVSWIFNYRWYNAILWSRSPTSSTASTRNLYWEYINVGRYEHDVNLGLSVRCIKN